MDRANHLLSISYPQGFNDQMIEVNTHILMTLDLLSFLFMVKAAKPHSLLQLYSSCVVKIKAYSGIAMHFDVTCLNSVHECPSPCAYFGFGDSTACLLR